MSSRRQDAGTGGDAITDLIGEALVREGTFQAKCMFGGLGLYLDGIFFGLVHEDILYFKVSDETRVKYDAEDMSAFSYLTKTGKRVVTSFRRVPERLLDDAEELAAWARTAAGAAHEVSKKRSPKRPRGSSTTGKQAKAPRPRSR